jgi:hypothetical protein
MTAYQPQIGDLVRLTGAASVDPSTVATVTRADRDRAGVLLIVEWADRRLSIDSTKVEPVAELGPFVHESALAGPYDCDCRSCHAAMVAEHEAECWAESAWLRHAERPSADDDVELAREAADPGLIYMAEQRELAESALDLAEWHASWNQGW